MLPDSKGKGVLTPLVCGPVDNSHLSDANFFSSDETPQNTCDVDLVMMTFQSPTNPSLPLGEFNSRS